MSYAGQIAALTTALLYALSSVGFATASRRVGSFVVNQFRIALAAVLLWILHAVLMDSFWPVMSPRQQGWLVFSGVVGLALGDLFYFHALGLLGPRLGTLLMSSFPIFTVLTQGLWLGQWPDRWHGLGIVLTLVGIAVVLAERRNRHPGTQRGLAGPRGWADQLSNKAFLVAILSGLLGALGQGAGLVLSEVGMKIAVRGESVVPGLSATLLRMWAGLFGMLALLPILRRLMARHGRRPAAPDGGTRVPQPWWQDRRAVVCMVYGAVLGPTLGVWLTQESLKLTQPAIAGTLVATTPIFMLPLARVIHGERISLRAVGGTLVAFAGVALLL